MKLQCGICMWPCKPCVYEFAWGKAEGENHEVASGLSKPHFSMVQPIFAILLYTKTPGAGHSCTGHIRGWIANKMIQQHMMFHTCYLSKLSNCKHLAGRYALVYTIVSTPHEASPFIYCVTHYFGPNRYVVSILLKGTSSLDSGLSKFLN